MSLVQDLTPINLEEEKQKFFDSDCKYNPQFKYSKLITINKLYKYGKPKPEVVELAKHLLEKAFHNRTEEDIRKMEGERINRQKAQKMIAQFLKENQIEDKVKVRWSEEFPGKASFFKDTLKLRLPVWHREKEFLGTIYHELGTHALRRINYAQQPFFKKKAQYGFKDYLRTEEGLASFHTLLAKTFKIDYTGALNYLACNLAQETSLSEVYSYVRQYLEDDERAWLYAYKVKRGLYDTSEGGGFTKNIVYLEGMIQVWEYFQKTDFDVEGLYLGKIDAGDIQLAKDLHPYYESYLPSFISKKFENYTSEVTKVTQANKLDSISL